MKQKVKCFFGKHKFTESVEVVPGWTGKIVRVDNLPYLLARKTRCEFCYFYKSEPITKGSKSEMEHAKYDLEIYDSPLYKAMKEEE